MTVERGRRFATAFERRLLAGRIALAIAQLAGCGGGRRTD